MKKSILLLLVILLSIPVLAQDWTTQSEELELEMDINSEFDIVPSSDDYRIQYVTARLLFYPRESSRQAVELDINHDYDKVDDYLEFTWQSPDEKHFEINQHADIVVKNELIKIWDKIDFPIGPVPSEIVAYIEPTINIDCQDRDIVALANQIAEGEDDLYVVVFKMSDWVKNNIEYSLNTITAEANQKSSWVLENRYGVCDEITSLFIAMLRSVGIPAKYVSGVAYTNWNDINDWGPHAWAEVYFPEHGWIPFDITYDQFGYVDPTHIVLRESDDSEGTSIKYEWKGHNIELESKNLEINTKLKNSRGTLQPNVGIEISVEKEDIGFGSYNLVKVQLENIRDYYVTTNLYLGKTTKVDILGDDRFDVLLKPMEKKEYFWLVKIPDLNRGYTYTFPMQAILSGNITAEAEFRSSQDDPVYSQSDLTDLMEVYEEPKTETVDLLIDCKPKSNTFYLDEKIEASCFVKNTGNIVLNDLKVCIKDVCKSVNLKLTQGKLLNYTLKFDEPGKKELNVKATNKDIREISSLKFEVKSRPVVKIVDVKYPETVEFNEQFNFEFTLQKVSSTPKDIKIVLSANGFEKTWETESLPVDRTFIVKYSGKQLDYKPNNFMISVVYHDDDGNEYTISDNFTINLVNVTFLQKVQVWLNRIVNVFNK